MLTYSLIHPSLDSERNQQRVIDLLIFADANSGATVYLPARQVSHWALSPGGSVTVWPVAGGPLFPVDSAGLLLQLTAAGLLPLPPAPSPPSSPSKKPHASQKA